MALRRSAVALLWLCLLMARASGAMAEVGYPTPTVQAIAADATWLAYTPPPEHPGIVCMVDSGVDPNPDTEAAVIGGQALAPETETNDEIARLEPKAQPGNHPNGHGTLMAMMMAAPINGWGMVGIAPTSVRVYNMKALPKGDTTFPFDYYSVAIAECESLRISSDTTMTVINLSLGGSQNMSGPELSIFENNVAAAIAKGMNVVAAAGNEGGPVLYPASYPPVLAVGAGDAGSGSGVLCLFASSGEGLDLIAPGCDSQNGGLEGALEDDGSSAVGSGSSQASAIVSAVLASMRAYDPDLTSMQAEKCLTSTTQKGSIDVAAAFAYCGLTQLVSEGQLAERAVQAGTRQMRSDGSQSVSNQATSINSQYVSGKVCAGDSNCTNWSSSGPVSPPRIGSKTTCPRPRIFRAVINRRHLILRIRGRSHGCRLQVRYRIRSDLSPQWILSHSTQADSILVSGRRFFDLQARDFGGSANRTSSKWIAVRASKEHD